MKQKEEMAMRRICLFCTVVVAWGLASALSAAAKSEEDKETKTGDTTVIAYEGSQRWPTGDSGDVLKNYAVPIYKGLPNKRYKVLGRIEDERQDGVDEVGKAFDDTFGSQKHRLRNCANQAKLHKGDAVMITDDERVLKALNLTKKDAKDASPLAHEKRKVVLIIKF